MADANQALLIFDDFLTHLRRQGFDIGVDHYLRLQELLLKAGTEFEPQELRTILCPIFATSRAQQEQFYRAFDNYFSLFQSISATTTSGGPLEEVLLPARQEIRPARSRKWFYVLGAVALVMLASAAVIWRQQYHTTITQNNPPPPTPTQTQLAPQASPRQPAKAQPSAPQPAEAQAAAQTSPTIQAPPTTTGQLRYERYASVAKSSMAGF